MRFHSEWNTHGTGVVYRWHMRMDCEWHPQGTGVEDPNHIHIYIYIYIYIYEV